VFLGVVSISLSRTIEKSAAADRQKNTMRYFKRLFPGNNATLNKLHSSFNDLDIDSDGSITTTELCYRYNQVTNAALGEETVNKINGWVNNLDSASQADGEINLGEYLEFMVFSLIENDVFTVRKLAVAMDEVVDGGETAEKMAEGNEALLGLVVGQKIAGGQDSSYSEKPLSGSELSSALADMASADGIADGAPDPFGHVHAKGQFSPSQIMMSRHGLKATKGVGQYTATPQGLQRTIKPDPRAPDEHKVDSPARLDDWVAQSVMKSDAADGTSVYVHDDLDLLALHRLAEASTLVRTLDLGKSEPGRYGV
jgi:hypothetical protein